MKRFFGGFFQFVYDNKNVHLVVQHPSLGSMTEGPINTSEILISIPRFGQELSICICFNRVEIDDLTHPK